VVVVVVGVGVAVAVVVVVGVVVVVVVAVGVGMNLLQDRLRTGPFATNAVIIKTADRLDEQDKRIAELEARQTTLTIELSQRACDAEEAEQEVARLSAHIQRIAEHHQLLADRWISDSEVTYHRERRDFALSIFATPTKGDSK
jgi:peptidoglycan hydrolase CwlO-like protein